MSRPSKIQVEMKHNILKCLCDLYDGIVEIEKLHPVEIQIEKEYKAVMNIMDILFVSMKTRLLKKNERSKPFKITFQYNQVYYLLNFISANSTFFHGVFERTILRSFAEKLHRLL